jgi:LysR family glycine cleavage system transcriptional activator
MSQPHRRSMLRAAEELHVTQSAVSKQIKTLEDWLGERLFERLHREITLTPTGQTYFEKITGPFSELEAATPSTARRHEKTTIRFCGYHTFNMRWLIPKLADFHAKHSHIQVEISAAMDMIDFKRIRWTVPYGRARMANTWIAKRHT